MPFNSYPIGSTPVPGTIGTTNAADTYPTHYDYMGSGGHRSVLTINDRNDIVTERRAFGMLVTVTNDIDPANNKTYILRNIAMGGVSDNLFDDPNWGEFQAGVPGPPGPVGIAPAGLTWQGIFDSDATNITYLTGDVVQYTDPTTQITASYWAVSDPTVVDDVTAPPTDVNGDPNTIAGWQLFSAIGPQGQPGDQGLPGDNGLPGDPGSQWFNGQLTPNTADPVGSIDGDYYLHIPPNDGTGNGDVYRKLNGSWISIGNIRGADGTGTAGLWPSNYPQTTTANISGFAGPAASQGYTLTGKTGFEILKDLLCPYANPALSNFRVYTANTTNSTGTTNTQNQIVEVGTVISGTRWFRVTITNPENITPSTMKVTQINNSGGQTIIYGSTAPGSVVPATNTIFPTVGVIINSVSYSIHGAIESWKASVSNTLNSLRESNSYTVTWRYKVYWGCSTALTLNTGSDITSLAGGIGSGALLEDQSNTYVFDQNVLGYRYLCYPVTSPFVGVSDWLDQNGANVPTATDPAQGFTNSDGQGRYYKQVSVTVNGNPVNYRVYRTFVQANSLAQFTL